MNLRSITLAITFLVSATIFAGGGWPKKKGKFYIKLSGWYLESDEHFSPFGDDGAPNTNAKLFNTNLYGEYGITDKFTATLHLPFYSRSVFDRVITDGTVTVEGEELDSFGDTQLGLKYGIYKNDYISISASVILDFPFGKTGKGGQGRLATGDGEFNQIFRTDVGISIYNSENVSIYGNVYGGINVRSKDFSEELRAGGELGAGFLDNRLWVVGKLDTIQSFNNGDRDADSGGSGIFVNNIEITTITPEVNVYITKRVGISAASSIPIEGKFVYTEPSYTAGIFYDFK